MVTITCKRAFYTSLIILLNIIAGQSLVKGWEEDWEIWKSKYNKMYDGHEELFRREIWRQNMEYINDHNNEAVSGQHSYLLAMNHLGDLTRSEYISTLHGFRQPLKTKQIALSEFIDIPHAVDWRDRGVVPPVVDQGMMEQSWVITTCYVIEAQKAILTGDIISLSRQQLLDCCNMTFNGIFEEAFECIIKQGGLDTEEAYPEKEVPEPCKFDPAGIGASISGYVTIPPGNETVLQLAVAGVGPIAAGIDAGHPSFQFYKSGVYDEPSCTEIIDHTVLVVGYGNLHDDDYWLVQNSWGVEWGVQGYIYMSRNKNNQCGIASAASYPTGVRQTMDV